MKNFVVVVFLLLSSFIVATEPAYAQVNLGSSSSATNPERSGDATTGLFSSTTGAVSVSSGGTEKMRVNGTGVGIGTASPATLLDVYSASATTGIRNIGTFALGTGSGGGFFADASTIPTATGQRVGGYFFGAYDGTTGYGSAAITGWSSEAWSSTDKGGYIQFETTATGATARTARMLIDPSGNVGIGTSSPAGTLDVEGGTAAASTNGNSINLVAQNGGTGNQNGGNIILSPGTATGTGTSGSVGIGTASPSYALDVNGQPRFSGTSDNLLINNTNSSSGATGIVITRTSVGNAEFFELNGSGIGSIGMNASTTSYYTTSDRRLKENIKPTTRGLDDLMKIGIQDYNFISDPEKHRVQGLIAQDLYSIYPEAVAVGGNDVKTHPWQIDYSRLTPLIIRSFQQANLKLDESSHDVEILRVADTRMAAQIAAQQREIGALKKELEDFEHLAKGK
jgi:hypothetical protein